jgi:hypothetical protein
VGRLNRSYDHSREEANMAVAFVAMCALAWVALAAIVMGCARVAPVTVWTIGVPWVDPGATAWDERDGDITDKIVTTGAVDFQRVGHYDVRYDVTDSSGNRADTVTRHVRVR